MSKTGIQFGTDGWRAVIADSFTFHNVQIASNAIGKFILENSNNKEWPIIIGYDPRFLAKDFAKLCASELLNLGLNVKLSDSIVPTPVIAYHAAKNSTGKTNGAIQFTASHNPPKYCGLKYITDYGGPAPVEITNKIMQNIENQDLGQDKSCPYKSLTTNYYFNPKPQYFSHVKNLINSNSIKNAKLIVVYDPLYGAGNTYLDFLLKETGCSITTIHNKVDPLFGGLLPEPKEEFLNNLKAAVLKTGAICGLATDGDADRLGAVDEKGFFYSPNKIAAMILRHLVKNKKLTGKVVRTLSTTHLMDHLAKKYNLEVVETKVGFKWICEEMIKGNVLIGAEESGGISIINHIPDKDAILSALLLVEMLSYEKKTLSEIFNDTVKDAQWSCINDKFDFHVAEKEKNSFISIMQSGDLKKYGDLPIESFNTVEGAKYILKDDSWFMARASGTEPMARVYFEATSDKVLNEMKAVVRKIFEVCQK